MSCTLIGYWNIFLTQRLHQFGSRRDRSAHAGVVSSVDNIAQIAIGLSRGTLFVSMGIGAFLGENLSYPLRVLDVATDPLLLWTFGIQALGVAVMARKNFGFGAAAVALGFVGGALLRGLAR